MSCFNFEYSICNDFPRMTNPEFNAPHVLATLRMPPSREIKDQNKAITATNIRRNKPMCSFVLRLSLSILFFL